MYSVISNCCLPAGLQTCAHLQTVALTHPLGICLSDCKQGSAVCEYMWAYISEMLLCLYGACSTEIQASCIIMQSQFGGASSKIMKCVTEKLLILYVYRRCLQVRFYSLHSNLDNSQLLNSLRLTSPVIKLNLHGNHLLLASRDCHVTIYDLSTTVIPNKGTYMYVHVHVNVYVDM